MENQASALKFYKPDWFTLTTAIPHVFVLVEGVPLLAIRAIIRIKVTARKDPMVMSSRNLFLRVGSIGIRKFILTFKGFHTVLFEVTLSRRIVIATSVLNKAVCIVEMPEQLTVTLAFRGYL